MEMYNNDGDGKYYKDYIKIKSIWMYYVIQL